MKEVGFDVTVWSKNIATAVSFIVPYAFEDGKALSAGKTKMNIIQSSKSIFSSFREKLQMIG